ncbi:MAG: YcxB family protein [Bordetella sp.]|nr:YcxB family protein [Bordetella sp.]
MTQELPTAALTVDLTVDDYQAFITHAHRRPELRKRRLRSHIRFAVILAVGLLLYTAARSSSAGLGTDWAVILPSFLQAAAVGLGALALMAVGFEYAVPAMARANVRRAFKRDPANPFLGRHHFLFEEAGVGDATEHASGSVPWDLIQSAEETNDYLFLFIAPLQGVILPKRGQDAASLAAVRAHLRAHVNPALLQA